MLKRYKLKLNQIIDLKRIVQARSLIYSLITKYELMFQILLILCLNFLVLKYLYRSLPSEEVYQSTSVIFNLYKSFSFKLLFFILVPLLIWNVKWDEIVKKHEMYIKYFILFVMSIWVWKVVTLDLNLYYNQAYHLDRIILLTLGILAFRFPIALIYVLVFSIVFFNQVSYPTLAGIFPNQYIDSTPLVDILILFVVYIFLKKVYTNFSILAFLVVALCLHASNYFIPGLAKILISEHYIDWMYVNDLSNIFAAQYFQGWLLDVFPWETIQTLFEIIHLTTIPMQVGAFVTQLIVISIFINKKYTLLLFASFEVLHLGVFIVSGIFFWKWILLNLSIIYVVNKLDNEQIKKIFNLKMMLFTIPMIVYGNIFFKPAWLGWYDGPLNNTFKVYATNTQGERYLIDQNLMAPYDILFAQRGFTFLMDEKLRPAWGASDTETMLKLKRLSADKNEIFKFEQKYGVNKYNAKKVEEFKNFLRLYFQHWNENMDKRIVWNYFTPPKHVYASLSWDEKVKQDNQVKYVEIVFFKTFYDHNSNDIIQLEEKSVLKVEV